MKIFKLLLSSGLMVLVIKGILSTSHAVDRVEAHEKMLELYGEKIEQISKDTAYMRGKMEGKIK